MKEARMVDKVQEALTRIGVDDEVVAAGMFFPRGHSGAAFAGGLVGGGIGDELGGVAGDVGMVDGVIVVSGRDAASACRADDGRRSEPGLRLRHPGSAGEPTDLCASCPGPPGWGHQRGRRWSADRRVTGSRGGAGGRGSAASVST